MTARDDAMAALAAAVSEAAAITRGLTREQRVLRSAAEGWPLVIVGYHIGLGLRRQAGWISRALTGDAPFAFDWEGTHELNAVMAREHGALSADEAAAGIADGWERLGEIARRMTDEDWGREVFGYDGRTRSADVVLRRIVLPHVTEHLESMRRTLAGEERPGA